MTATPGSILPGGIVLIDEPAHCHVTTFASNGEVMLVFNTRRGGDCGQVFIGLSARQAQQVIERLSHDREHIDKAVAEGRGGAEFPNKAP